MPIRSNSLRAMMVNSASPLPAGRGADRAPRRPRSAPATGACTRCTPPSGSVSRASDLARGDGVAGIRQDFRTPSGPCRSGRTEVSSRGSTMPDTSTLLSKQDLAALSTVTAAPFGADLGGIVGGANLLRGEANQLCNQRGEPFPLIGAHGEIGHRQSCSGLWEWG